MQGEKGALKLNITGLVGGILAFVSLALPWWTLSVSSAVTGFGNFSVDVSIYPYMASMAGLGVTAIDLWFGWIALAFIIVGGLLGIIGSLKPDRAKVLLISGALALVSIIIFAVGLQIMLLQGLGLDSSIFLFGSGSLSASEYGADVNYLAYLSFGFWIALIAAIMMFAASRKKPAQIAGFPPPPPPPAAWQ
jgi:hypothetical protein